VRLLNLRSAFCVTVVSGHAKALPNERISHWKYRTILLFTRT
jgi:hypothetical protein